MNRLYAILVGFVAVAAIVITNASCEPPRDATTTPTIPSGSSDSVIDIEIGGENGLDVEVGDGKPTP